MLIADFGFGDYDTDAVRAFLLMFLVGVASVSERSTVLVVPNVLFEYFCVCSLSSSNAVANEFDRAITNFIMTSHHIIFVNSFFRASTSSSIWDVAAGKAGLSFHTNLHLHITSHHRCQFFCSHHMVVPGTGEVLASIYLHQSTLCAWRKGGRHEFS